MGRLSPARHLRFLYFGASASPARREEPCRNQKENLPWPELSKVIELMAESSKSWEDAAQNAATEASKTLRNIRSLYIKDFTASVDNGKVRNYRISAKVTFDLERGED